MFLCPTNQTLRKPRIITINTAVVMLLLVQTIRVFGTSARRPVVCPNTAVDRRLLHRLSVPDRPATSVRSEECE